jgi:hypothetical protein
LKAKPSGKVRLFLMIASHSHTLITSIAKRRLRAFPRFRKVLINTVCSFAAYAARGGYNYINVGWKALAGKNSHSRERFTEVMSVL